MYAPNDDEENLKYLAELNAEVPELEGDSLSVTKGPVPKIPQTPAAEPPPEPEAMPDDEAAEPAPDDEAVEYELQVPEQQTAPGELQMPRAAAPALDATPKLIEPKWQDFDLPKTTPAPAGPTQTATNYDSKLVSKAPDWFNFDQPPEYTGTAPALLALAAGLIQAGVAPDKKSAIAMALGGLADAATVKLAAPQQDYQNKLKAAQAQAQMTATLRSGQGGANDALGWERLRLERERMDRAAQTAEQKAALAKELEDKNSPASKRMQEAAAPFMGDQAYGLSGAQLMWAKSQYGAAARQETGQENRTTNFNRGQDATFEKEQRGNDEFDRRFDTRQNAEMDKEERVRNKELAQGNLPGYKWENGYAPEPADVRAARSVLISKNTVSRAARELAALQDKITLTAQAGGDFYKAFGGDAQQGQILDRMKRLTQSISANIRNIDHMGVPQKFELELVEKVNPNADSIKTFFIGPGAWLQLANDAEIAGDEILTQGYGLVKQSPSQAQTVDQLIKGENMTLPRRNSQQRIGETKKVLETPSETIPQAVDLGKSAVKAAGRAAGQVVAPATDAARTIMIQIQGPGGDWSSAREVTMEQYKKLTQKLQNKGIRSAR